MEQLELEFVLDFNLNRTGGTLTAYLKCNAEKEVAKMSFHIDDPRHLIVIKSLSVNDNYLNRGISKRMIQELIFCTSKELTSGYALCGNSQPFTHDFSLTKEKWTDTLISQGVRVERLHDIDREADLNRYKILKSRSKGVLWKIAYWYNLLR